MFNDRDLKLFTLGGIALKNRTKFSDAAKTFVLGLHEADWKVAICVHNFEAAYCQTYNLYLLPIEEKATYTITDADLPALYELLMNPGVSGPIFNEPYNCLVISSPRPWGERTKYSKSVIDFFLRVYSRRSRCRKPLYRYKTLRYGHTYEKVPVREFVTTYFNLKGGMYEE